MVIVETSTFTRRVQELLSDEDYRKLQTVLINRPNTGAIIPGSGGLRKVRWALSGRGKRGGVRVIYYWAVRRGRVPMKNELFNELVASVREGGAILRGEAEPSRAFAVDGPNIKRIRANYRLSQGQFAALLGISVGTLRNWEQGRRTPDGPARVLLHIAAKHPDAVWDVVRAATRQSRSVARPSKARRTVRS